MKEMDENVFMDLSMQLKNLGYDVSSKLLKAYYRDGEMHFGEIIKKHGIEQWPMEALSKFPKLCVQYCEFTHLPDNIDLLGNVVELNLAFNQLITLPDSIGRLSNLKKLYLWDNDLQTIPRFIGELGNLEVLDLTANHKASIPATIFNIEGLKKLGLSMCGKLISLPAEIANLVSLEELELTHTGITTLPESIGKLQNLRILDLRGTPLKTLPSSLEQLDKLEGIYINYTNRERINLLPKKNKAMLGRMRDRGCEVPDLGGFWLPRYLMNRIEDHPLLFFVILFLFSYFVYW